MMVANETFPASVNQAIMGFHPCGWLRRNRAADRQCKWPRRNPIVEIGPGGTGGNQILPVARQAQFQRRPIGSNQRRSNWLSQRRGEVRPAVLRGSRFPPPDDNRRGSRRPRNHESNSDPAAGDRADCRSPAGIHNRLCHRCRRLIIQGVRVEMANLQRPPGQRRNRLGSSTSCRNTPAPPSAAS